jgi:hypothetical protein
MRDEIQHAFLAMRGQYPPDRVVADPELNRAFIAERRRQGMDESVKRLNQLLLNLRKGGKLKGLPRSRPTSFRSEDEYRFASEVSARHLKEALLRRMQVVALQPALSFFATAFTSAGRYLRRPSMRRGLLGVRILR